MFIGTDLTNIRGFNTQPPEGGCHMTNVVSIRSFMFQHTATRRRLPDLPVKKPFGKNGFNTQPPEGGCPLHKKARKISVLNTVFR